MADLTIGKLAKMTGFSVECIRYYERFGLLPKPKRRESLWGHGYRQYTEEDVKRLLFIKQAKKLGFTLKQICDLLSLRLDKKANCDAVRNKAKEKLLEVYEKLNSLEQIKVSLEKLIKDCETRRILDRCPILDAISKNIEHKKQKER